MAQAPTDRLTTSQAARYCGVAANTIRAAGRAGELRGEPYGAVGGPWEGGSRPAIMLWPVAELDRWARAREDAGRPLRGYPGPLPE